MLETSAPKEAVYLLADHLDAALAAGEDLLKTRLPALADLDTAEDAAEREIARFIMRLGRLEEVLVGRVLQARRRLGDLPRNDPELKPVVNLFLSSTGLLIEMIERFGEQSQACFDAGTDRLPFLRDRGLLARDAAGLPLYESLVVTSGYRIGATVELGPVLDMIAALLDLLDRRYDLYGDELDHELDPRALVTADASDETRIVDANPNFATSSGDGHVIDSVAATTRRRPGRAARAPTASTPPSPSDAAPLTAASLMQALQDIERPV